MRIAIYIRFSSTGQRGNFSVDVQDRAAREFIERRQDLFGQNPEIVTVKDEARSGSSFDRPAYLDLESRVKAGEFAAVVVYDYSRFGRNAIEAEQRVRWLGYYGAPVHSATEPAHPFVRWVLAGVAQQYREDLGRKCAAGLREAVAAGFWANKAPFGYRLKKVRVRDGKRGERTQIEVEPHSARIVRRIFTLYGQRRKGMARIADTLNREGVKSPRGSTWDAGGIRAILVNPIYSGQQVSGRYRIERDPAGKRKVIEQPRESWTVQPRPDLRIVPAPLFETVRARFERRTRAKRTGNGRALAADRSSRYLLSGLIRCGHCPGGYAVAEIVGGRKRPSYYLACSHRKRRGESVCSNSTRYPMAAVENAVLQAVQQKVLDKTSVEARLDSIERALDEFTTTANQLESAQRRELADIDRKRARLVDALAEGEAGLDAVKERLRELESRRKEIRAQLGATGQESDGARRRRIIQRARKHLENLQQMFGAVRERAKAPTEDFRVVLSELIDSAALRTEGGKRFLDIGLKESAGLPADVRPKVATLTGSVGGANILTIELPATQRRGSKRADLPRFVVAAG